MNTTSKIDRSLVRDILALTPLQKGILFHHLKEPGSGAYEAQLDLAISGAVDRRLFEETWRIITAQYDMLRTVFRWEGITDAVQLILKQHTPHTRFFDLTPKTGEDKTRAWEEIKTADREKGFDLQQVPFRVALCRWDTHSCHLLVSHHHILYDGWSTGILLKRFFRVYHDLYHKREIPHPGSGHFKEYLRRLQKQQETDRHETFWSRYLDDFEAPLSPLREPGFSGTGKQILKVRQPLSPRVAEALQSLCKSRRITRASVYYTAWGILLQRYLGGHDAVFGTTLSGRSAAVPHIEEMVGLFINTLPLRFKFPAQALALEVIKEVDRDIHNREAHETTPLIDIARYARRESGAPLFDSVVVLENYPLDGLLADHNPGTVIKAAGYSVVEASNYPLALGIFPGEVIEVEIAYHGGYFSHHYIRDMLRRWSGILETLVSFPQRPVHEIQLITPQERRQILEEFNATGRDFNLETTALRLFEDCAAARPHRIAVIDGEEHISCRQLDLSARRWARYLRERGVCPGDIVAIVSNCSIGMLSVMPAAWKTGAAYLPIDPQFPRQRIDYILEDAGAKLCLENPGQSPSPAPHTSHRFHSNREARSAAYVIYTSGTTGRPRAVLVGHRGVVNLIYAHREVFGETCRSRMSQVAGSGFDAMAFEVWPCLAAGAVLCIAGSRERRDPVRMKEWLISRAVHISFQPTRMVEQLLKLSWPAHHVALEALRAAGDRLASYPARHYPFRVYNLYGPTEDTVWTTWTEVPVKPRGGGFPSIGTPLFNHRVYILSAGGRLQPPGIPGELAIAGEGLATGYLNRPQLTAEKFIEAPSPIAARLYKTGDLAVYRRDGTIHFLGRIDTQIKIRGYRIEVGEVQTRLLEHPDLSEVEVVAGRRDTGYLCAYLVPEKGKKAEPAELRKWLGLRLPDYMVPAYFMILEKMPLTPNGKIDYRALPEPRAEVETGYQPAVNDIENILLTLWKDVLGGQRYGVSENFFRVGGDSIKAMQVAARLAGYKLKLEVQDFFLHPTVKALAACVKPLEQAVPQEPVQGDVPITPVQHWFFKNRFTNPHHFNHSVSIQREEGFDENAVFDVFTRIMRHHDALRMVFNRKDGAVAQFNRDIDCAPPEMHVRTAQSPEAFRQQVETEMNRLHQSMDLTSGPLVKLLLFKTPGCDYLFIIIHHLVVDGVSWRIIVEDLETGLRQWAEGKEIVFPPKTASYRQWALALEKYARGSALAEEISFWQAKDKASIPPLPRRRMMEPRQRLLKHARTLTVTLNPADTRKLLNHVHHAYNTGTNDILLTALALALKQWAGLPRTAVYLEGHGRENLPGCPPVDRTVGWFTSLFPVVMDLEGTHGIGTAVKRIKETLREIPYRGAGYGILKYLAPPDRFLGEAFRLKPEISFNFLGQFQQQGKDGGIEVSRRFLGNETSPQMQAPYPLVIYGIVDGGETQFYFMFQPEEFPIDAMTRLTEAFNDALTAVIRHCAARKETELTPSDLDYPGLTLDGLELLKRQMGPGHDNIRNVYPLSPMQNGMLFHYLKDKEANAYFEQAELELQGTVDPRLLEQGMNILVQRYDILRTAFTAAAAPGPMQVVLKKRDMKVAFIDLSHLDDSGLEQALEAHRQKDRQQGIDLTRDVLLRLTLFKTRHDSRRLLWSFHHIIMDGWCVAVILEELLTVYAALRKGDLPDLEPPVPFSRYIHWLEQQDKVAGKAFWAGYLEGYCHRPCLPQSNSPGHGEPYLHRECLIHLDEATSRALVELAAKNRVTPNTLFQTLWGILLQKYGNTDDVVFGTVVSGRPPQIPGIERMVGIFINTLPVRVNASGSQTVVSLMQQVQDRAVACKPYEYVPLAEIQAALPGKINLVDTLLIFENFPFEDRLRQMCGSSETGFTISRMTSRAPIHYPLNLLVLPGSSYGLLFKYNARIYDDQFIRRVAGSLQQIITQLLNRENINIAEIEVTSASEKQTIMSQLTDDLEDE